jgi:hypothetical protein
MGEGASRADTKTQFSSCRSTRGHIKVRAAELGNQSGSNENRKRSPVMNLYEFDTWPINQAGKPDVGQPNATQKWNRSVRKHQQRAVKN